MAHRLLSSCGTRAAKHTGSVAVVWPQLPRGMWDLSSPTRDPTGVPCIGRRILNRWTTREVPLFQISFCFSIVNVYVSAN